MSVQKFYSPEHYVERPDELEIRLDEKCVDIAIDHDQELLDHAEGWFRLYYHARRLDKRPAFDDEHCHLNEIQIIPYARPDTLEPALALIGIYDMGQEPFELDGKTYYRTILGEDEPLLIHIDTHGGNFEYLSCGVAYDSNAREIQLSEDFSIHLAEIMLAYYKDNTMER